MRELLIIPTPRKHFDDVEKYKPEQREKELLRLQYILCSQLQIIKSLPEKTVVHLGTSDPQYIEYFKSRLTPKQFDRILFFDSETANYNDIGKQPAIWAQDIFHTAKGVAYISSAEVAEKVKLRRGGAGQWLSMIGLTTKKIPLPLVWGNIDFTRATDGKTIALVGSSELLAAQKYHAITENKGRIADFSSSDFERILKEHLKVDEVMILGVNFPPRGQPEAMFHIDQSVLPLSKGVVAIVKIIPGKDLTTENVAKLKDCEEHLSEYRRLLSERGFKIIDVPTPASDILEFRSFVNGNIYKENGGRLGFIMPSYVRESGDPNNPYLLTDEFAIQAARALIEGAKKLGIKLDVRHSLNITHIDGGNIHCLTQRLD